MNVPCGAKATSVLIFSLKRQRSGLGLHSVVHIGGQQHTTLARDQNLWVLMQNRNAVKQHPLHHCTVKRPLFIMQQSCERAITLSVIFYNNCPAWIFIKLNDDVLKLISSMFILQYTSMQNTKRIFIFKSISSLLKSHCLRSQTRHDASL